MENQERLSIIRFSLSAAKISFIIGTIIFLSYCCTRYSAIVPIGLFYLVFAFIINSLILLVLLISLITSNDKYAETLKTMGIMFLNVPIAWLYLYLVLELQSSTF